MKRTNFFLSAVATSIGMFLAFPRPSSANTVPKKYGRSSKRCPMGVLESFNPETEPNNTATFRDVVPCEFAEAEQAIEIKFLGDTQWKPWMARDRGPTNIFQIRSRIQADAWIKHLAYMRDRTWPV